MWVWGTCGCGAHVGAGTCGCRYMWVQVHVGAGTCGCRYMWVQVHVGAGTCGCRYMWVGGTCGFVAHVGLWHMWGGAM